MYFQVYTRVGRGKRGVVFEVGKVLFAAIARGRRPCPDGATSVATAGHDGLEEASQQSASSSRACSIPGMPFAEGSGTGSYPGP